MSGEDTNPEMPNYSDWCDQCLAMVPISVSLGVSESFCRKCLAEAIARIERLEPRDEN